MGLVDVVKSIMKSPSKAFVVRRYFTMWALMIHIVFHKSKTIDKRLLAQIVSTGGFYFTFIHPRRLQVPMKNEIHTIKGLDLIVMDVLTHHFPYAYEVKLNTRYTSASKMATLGCLVVYMSTNNVFEVYGIRKRDMMNIAILNVFVMTLKNIIT